MTEHAHHWDPIPLQMRRYVCACGAQAYKRASGELREVLPGSRRKIGGEPTVRQRESTVMVHGTCGLGDSSFHGVRVSALPSLDEQEKRKR